MLKKRLLLVLLAYAARLIICKPCYFLRIWYTKQRLWPRAAFVAETVETRNKNHCMTKAMNVLQRKLTVGLELFWNRSVHKFYCLKVLITLEQVNTLVVEKKKKNLNFSKRLTGQVS